MDWEDKRIITKVAMLYYLDGLTQAEIAKRYGVSRPVISKVLQRAKEIGVVEIYIKDENVHTIQLEQQLEKMFNLKEAIVVSSTGLSDEIIKKNIGKAASSYISNHLTDSMKIGMSWGTTLEKVVEEFPYQKMDSIHIVPLVGGMGPMNVGIHANQLAYEFAKKVNGKCSYLYAPAMVESDELKDRLIESEYIATVLQEGKRVDMALVGVGNPYQSSNVQNSGYLKQEDIAELSEAGVVGDINSKFFNGNGEQVKHSLNDRVIGIDLEDIRNADEVVGIAHGEYKAKSIKAALKSRFMDVLITDDLTAEKIVE